MKYIQVEVSLKFCNSVHGQVLGSKKISSDEVEWLSGFLYCDVNVAGKLIVRETCMLVLFLRLVSKFSGTI